MGEDLGTFLSKGPASFILPTGASMIEWIMWTLSVFVRGFRISICRDCGLLAIDSSRLIKEYGFDLVGQFSSSWRLWDLRSFIREGGSVLSFAAPPALS